MRFRTLPPRLMLVLSATLMVFGALRLPGQMPGTQGSFNPALLQIFAEHKAFTVKADIRMIDKNNKEVIRTPIQLSYLGGKVRASVNLNEITSESMGTEALTLFKKAGMDQVVSVLRPDRKLSVVFFPTAKALAEEPMNEAEAAGFNSKYEIKRTPVGEERIESRTCAKSRITVTGAGQTIQGTVWTAPDLKGFPIRIQLPEGENLMEMTFRDVQIQAPAASLFESPAGYKKYPGMEALIQDRLKQVLGGGK